MARRARTPRGGRAVFPKLRGVRIRDGTGDPLSKRREEEGTLLGEEEKAQAKKQLTVNENGLIMQRTNPTKGRMYDYGIFKSNPPKLPGVRPQARLRPIAPDNHIRRGTHGRPEIGAEAFAMCSFRGEPFCLGGMGEHEPRCPKREEKSPYR